MSADRKVTDISAVEDMLLSSIIDDLSMEICFEMHYNVSLKSVAKETSAGATILMTTNCLYRLHVGQVRGYDSRRPICCSSNRNWT
jgi:hypothetical protein